MINGKRHCLWRAVSQNGNAAHAHGFYPRSVGYRSTFNSLFWSIGIVLIPHYALISSLRFSCRLMGTEYLRVAPPSARALGGTC